MPNSIGSIYRSYPRRQLVLAGCGMGVFALAAGCVVWDLAVGPERGIAAVAAASLGLGIIFLLGTLGRQATRPKYEVGDGLAAYAYLTKALRCSEERLRAFAELSADWFWEQDSELRYSWFSEGIDASLASSLRGCTQWELTIDGIGERQIAGQRADLAAHRSFHDFRCQHTGSDGVVRQLSLSGRPIFDDSGAFCGYRGVGRVVSRQSAPEQAAPEAAAEAEWQRSLAEETSRQLLEAQRLGKIGHWFSDEAGRTVTWSPQVYEIAGLPPGSEIPMNIPRKVVHPDDLAEYLKVRALAIETRTTLMLDQRWVRPDGDIRWVHLEINPRFDSDGNCIGLFGTTQDITQWKASEVALSQAQEQLVDAIESISEGFVLFDREDRYVLTNSKYREMYPEMVDTFTPGSTYEAMVRTGIARGTWNTEGDREEFARKLVKWHRDAHEPMERQLRDGRWVRATERRTRDGGLVGIRTDITERKAAEDALKAARNQLSDAIEAISEGFVLFDAEDRYVMTNSNYRRLFPGIADLCIPGNSFEDVLRGNVERGIQDIGDEGGEAWIRKMLEWHRACSEPREQRATSGHWVRIVERRTRDGGIVGIRTDITQIKAAEEALVRKVADLEEARSRLEDQGRQLTAMAADLEAARDTAIAASRTKSEFLANMSHELRTPLNAIIGFSEVMTSAIFGDLNLKYRDYASDIHNAGHHLLEILNEILDLSKIEAGRLELHDGVLTLQELFDGCQRMVRERAEMAGITIEFPVTDLALRADELRIKQALLNLLSNAIKFTAQGGRITVAVGLTVADDIRISVSDTGIGIAKEHIAQVLEPFGQVADATTRTHQGTGLGLPLARRLIELHGGEMLLDSTLGQGTTVALTLPPSRTIKASPEPKAVAAKKRRDREVERSPRMPARRGAKTSQKRGR